MNYSMSSVKCHFMTIHFHARNVNQLNELPMCACERLTITALWSLHIQCTLIAFVAESVRRRMRHVRKERFIVARLTGVSFHL
jgi:hypothetical protein